MKVLDVDLSASVGGACLWEELVRVYSVFLQEVHALLEFPRRRTEGHNSPHQALLSLPSGLDFLFPLSTHSGHINII